jgi:hypothetical protein
MNTIIEHITSDNGFISTNCPDVGKITFYAKLPKCAVVKAVRLNGVLLGDMLEAEEVRYFRERKDGDFREVGYVDFGNAMIENEEIRALVSKIDSYEIQEFDVYYEEEAVVEI